MAISPVKPIFKVFECLDKSPGRVAADPNTFRPFQEAPESLEVHLQGNQHRLASLSCDRLELQMWPSGLHKCNPNATPFFDYFSSTLR